jgi:hypothetical protein
VGAASGAITALKSGDRDLGAGPQSVEALPELGTCWSHPHIGPRSIGM